MRRVTVNRLRLFAKQLSHELHAYGMDALSGFSRRVEFVIFSGGRRGSHLLIDLINTHPRIHCDSEILHPGRVRQNIFLRSYLRGNRSLRRDATYGFKVSLNQLRRQADPSRFLQQFQKSGGKIVYLRRVNHFRAAVSSLIARQRGQYHDRDDNPLSGDTFNIDVDELLRRLHNRCETDAEESRLLAGIPHLPVCYETDLLISEQHQVAADRIFDLLGQERVDVETQLRRTSPPELSDVISNFEQIVSAVQRSEFSSLISNDQAAGHAA